MTYPLQVLYINYSCWKKIKFWRTLWNFCLLRNKTTIFFWSRSFEQGVWYPIPIKHTQRSFYQQICKIIMKYNSLLYSPYFRSISYIRHRSQKTRNFNQHCSDNRELQLLWKDSSSLWQENEEHCSVKQEKMVSNSKLFWFHKTLDRNKVKTAPDDD